MALRLLTRSAAARGAAVATAAGAAALAFASSSSSSSSPSPPPPPPLRPRLVPAGSYDYDILVLGGGSGGLACAREAAGLGGRVGVVDSTTPSPRGTRWGLGGTCVNVGCIPKKLIHHAGLIGESIRDAPEFGWDVAVAAGHDWAALARAVQDHVRGLSFGYTAALRDEGVDHIRARGRVVDAHTVEVVEDSSSRRRTVTAAHIVVAVGGRPAYPDGVPGARELGITSDDLFWRRESPGKTLVVGAGYVALECAGALRALGLDTTVLARGPVLRGFDRDMSDRIVRGMAAAGTRFIRGAQPVRLEEAAGPPQGAARRIRVTWRAAAEMAQGGTADGSAAADGSALQLVSPSTVLSTEEFDTVIFATGRAPSTRGLGLEDAGVVLDGSGKIVGGGARAAAASAASTAAPRLRPHPLHLTSTTVVAGGGGGDPWSETSSVPSIHAIGDVLADRPELTPVAIRAGKLLARRIMTGVLPTEGGGGGGGGGDGPFPVLVPSTSRSRAALCMDYALVPTTVFTPVEYSCVGLSEEEAAARYGGLRGAAAAAGDLAGRDGGGIEVFHLAYDTLELSMAHRLGQDGLPLPPQCYAKLITTAGTATTGAGADTLSPSAAPDPATQRILGLHVLGPHAGEVVQGFAVALRMGASKADLEATVGLHPTHAEEVLGLSRTKSSGQPYLKSSC
jgi:thioredoxin reductase (NADPH)